ncbi:MAG: T9SS C-terminal target domain-containing protein [Ignavibacteriae bacterium]|nr:T9SS C-terminal target domain-containing protein [Ignavibacteriota bacterium]
MIFPFSLLLISTCTFAESGGPLSPEQAAYNVNFYDLDLSIDPVTKSIGGSLLCRAEVINSLTTFVLDLDNPFTVDSVLFKKGGGDFETTLFNHTNGKINITIPVSVSAGDFISAKVFYNGAPRIASNPPWGVGFVWDTTPSGKPWIGVACEDDGADIWWACKDHPSDEPDSMRMKFTVPNPLTCVSNGRFIDSTDNGDNTSTFEWFISTPINNYNVTIYAAEFSLIEDTYQCVSGEEIPFYFWVLPEYYNTAVNYMDVFLNEFNFLEAICGPFPFGTDKHGWAHAPYWGMEHQTIIAYGHNFTTNSWGFDYIHYHELAHEWWGNLISAKDWADVWIHEGLATYTEALYVEHLSGMDDYHQYMDNRRPSNNHSYPLAPTEPMTAAQAFDNLNPYYRGASVMHTLRYHVGDSTFFNLLKRWAYPDSNDYDNTNGRLCQILTTDNMKEKAETATGRELDPFFDVFFREASYPVLNVVRGTSEAAFSWSTENSIPLDVNIPITVNGIDKTVEMTAGEGSIALSLSDNLVLDPKKWLLMDEPNIVTNFDDGNLGTTHYRVEQNYPNPFNPTTKIQYQIPVNGFVQLKVYDVLGNEIAELVSEDKSKGIYSVDFDTAEINGREITSGVYFYTITVNDFVQTNKMLLLR